MKISIIVEDGLVVFDNQITIEVENMDQLMPDPNISAVQIENGLPEIEYFDGSPNAGAFNQDQFQAVIDAATAIKDAPPTLEQEQFIKQAEIASYLNLKLAEGINYMSETFALDPLSQSKWLALYTMAKTHKENGTPYSQDLIAISNQRVTMNEDDLLIFGPLCLDRVSALTLKARDHKDAVLAMSSIATIQSYDHTVGWD